MTESSPSIVPLLAFALLLNWLFAILYWTRRYQIFYRYLKESHFEAWHRLMRQDSMVEAFGEWFRWPFGSWQLITFYYRKEVDFDDSRLRDIKTFAKPTGAWVLVASVGVIAGLPVLLFLVEKTLSTVS